VEERGYDISGSGVIKREGQIIGRVEQITVHIYPEEIFLSIDKTPATAPLIGAFLDPSVPKLEIVIEVDRFHYVAKEAKVNTATLEGKKGEIIYLVDVQILPFEIEKIPS